MEHERVKSIRIYLRYLPPYSGLLGFPKSGLLGGFT